MNNEQHAIDIKVRQTLENLETPYKADHWTLMAGKLSALDAAETDFDKDLAGKLANLEVPFHPATWASMSSKLDALDAHDAAFDNILAEKLGRIEIPYHAANWANMASKLDDLDHSEAQFDNLLGQRLQNMDAKYKPKHWDLMAEKIEETFSWRAKIMRYKVVEVALVLLTLFTASNMLDLPFDFTKESSLEIEVKGKGQEAKKDKGQKTTPQKAKEIKSFYPADWRNRSETPNIKDAKREQNATGQPIVSADNVNSEIVPNAVVTQSLPSNIELNTVANSVKAALTEVEKDNAPKLVHNTEGVALTEIPTKKVLAIGQVINSDEGAEVEPLVGEKAMAQVLSPMDIRKPSLLNASFYDDNVIFPRSKEKRAKLRLNVFGLPIADMVTTNVILNRERKQSQQTVANLGAGMTVAYKKNKLEVEAGISYLDKKYDLPNVEVTNGSFLRGYSTSKPQTLRLSIVSVPISVNYTAKETNRWRFYARLGTAFNTILKTKEEQFVETTNNTQNTNNYGYGAQQPDLNKVELNLYPKGASETGFNRYDIGLKKYTNQGVTKNTYLTANAGLGVEYRLTRKTDIYVQPTFDYHLGKRGIGTLDDRIHTFSVQGGVKTKLK